MILNKKTRHGDIIIYRHIFCKLARDMKYSWPKIGKFLNLSHASIIHGANSIKQYIKIGDKKCCKRLCFNYNIYKTFRKL